jgi:surfactin synthase thioesterase subunit
MKSASGMGLRPRGRGCLRRYGGRAQPLMRLICFPWCGAGASVYRRLGPSLPDYIELLSVQLPGREDRFSETRLFRMEQVVEHVLGDIVSVFDRPLVLFGHSMGALVAYETALALKASIDREPDCLVVSGHESPDAKFVANENWHMADDSKFISYLGELGGTSREILDNPEIMRILLPALRSDYEVLEKYTYSQQPPLSCPLIACAGEEDKEVSSEDLYSWGEYTTGPYEAHLFPGDHFYLCDKSTMLTHHLQNWIASLGTPLKTRSLLSFKRSSGC